MKRADRLALGGALAVPWLFIWQGLDFTDQGYLLTGYRCFFRHPEATEDSASLWLTNLVGAIWDAMFGWCGVLGMRALWALCLSLGMLLAFRSLSRLTSERSAALAVLVASLFLSDRRETWFSYNTSSALLFVVAALCMQMGILRRCRWWLFGAGASIGILPFARIPNLLSAVLPSALLLAALLEAERRKTLLREIGFTLLGMLAGIVGMLLLIRGLGHAPLFIQGIRDLFAPATQNAGYSAGSLLSMFLREESKALAWGLAVCVVCLAISRVLGRVSPLLGWLVLAGVAALGVYGLSQPGEPWSFVVPGTVYWVLAAVVFGLWGRSLPVRVLAFVALVVTVIAPLGSNNGIKNAHMGLWLSLPLVLSLVAELGAQRLAGQGAKLALLGGVVLAGEAVHQIATYTYRDAPRAQLFTSISDPQLRGQLTTPARAKVVGEVLAALRQRVMPGDYLLAYDGTPLLQYLTKTRPYLNRPWLMGVESGEVIARLAADAPHRTGCLPVAVVSTRSTRGPEWPQHARRLEEKQPQRGVRLALRAFLREHGYRRKWSNGFFEIFEPPGGVAGGCR
jgi:hypothetical protein